MKTRNGFVSNSSSSSFVIIYRPVKVTEKLDKKYNYVGFGKSFDGGIDMFELTSEMVDLLNKDDNRMWSDDLELSVGEIVCWAEDSMDLTDELLVYMQQVKSRGKVVAEGGECDQNSTDNIKDFKERYIDGDGEGD